MWFKLASATFQNSLGKMSDLSNSWPVSYTLSGGINKSSCPSFVTKNSDGTQAAAAFTAIFTIKTGESLTSIKAFIGGEQVGDTVTTGNSITIAATDITGPITIEAIATGSSGGGNEGGDSTVTPPSGSDAGTIINSITMYDDNITYSSSKTVGSTGALTDSTSYDSYTIILPSDGTIYVDEFSIAQHVYIAIYHSGTATRYRKSDSNLPEASNPLSVKAGDTLIVSSNLATAHTMRIIYDIGVNDNVNLITINGSTMTKNESKTASGVALNDDTNYHTYAWTSTVKGLLYLSDADSFTYCALQVHPNEEAVGTRGQRYRKSDSNLPTTNTTLVPIGIGSIVYVSIRDEDSPTFNLSILTES